MHACLGTLPSRLYTLPCRSVNLSVRPHFSIAIGFCVTAPAQLSATELPCIRPCWHPLHAHFMWRNSILPGPQRLVPISTQWDIDKDTIIAILRQTTDTSIHASILKKRQNTVTIRSGRHSMIWPESSFVPCIVCWHFWNLCRNFFFFFSWKERVYFIIVLWVAEPWR